MPEIIIRRAMRNVAAADVDQRNLQKRRRLSHGKNLVPVTQYQHRVGPCLRKNNPQNDPAVSNGLCRGERTARTELQMSMRASMGASSASTLRHGMAKGVTQMSTCDHHAGAQNLALFHLFC